MNQIKLYFDEDAMDDDVAEALRIRGIDVLTVAQAGRVRHSDEEQLRYARDQARVLYSFNIGDFFDLHTQWMEGGSHHAGIILARQKRYSVAEQFHRLVHLASALDAEAMRDRVEFLSAC